MFQVQELLLSVDKGCFIHMTVIQCLIPQHLLPHCQLFDSCDCLQQPLRNVCLQLDVTYDSTEERIWNIMIRFLLFHLSVISSISEDMLHQSDVSM